MEKLFFSLHNFVGFAICLNMIDHKIDIYKHINLVPKKICNINWAMIQINENKLKRYFKGSEVLTDYIDNSYCGKQSPFDVLKGFHYKFLTVV